MQWSSSLCGPQIFPQAVMWPFMLAVVDHPDADNYRSRHLVKESSNWNTVEFCSGVIAHNLFHCAQAPYCHKRFIIQHKAGAISLRSFLNLVSFSDFQSNLLVAIYYVSTA